MTKLRNRVVLITSAGDALGYALATKFAKSGARLILWDANSSRGERVADEMRRLFGVTAAHYQVNMADPKQLEAAVAAVQRDFQAVDVLVNNADVLLGEEFLSIPDQDIETTMRTNTMAHAWLLQALLPAMIERKQGHIVTVATCVDVCGAPRLVDYCASKAAVAALHEGVRQEIRGLRIKKLDVQLTLARVSFESTLLDPAKPKLPLGLAAKPDAIANAIVHAVARNRKTVVVPAHVQVLDGVFQLLPQRAADWVRDKLKLSRVTESLRQDVRTM